MIFLPYFIISAPVISLNVSSECYEERNGTIEIQIIASLNASFEYTVTVTTRDGTAEGMPVAI